MYREALSRYFNSRGVHIVGNFTGLVKEIFFHLVANSICHD